MDKQEVNGTTNKVLKRLDNGQTLEPLLCTGNEGSPFEQLAAVCRGPEQFITNLTSLQPYHSVLFRRISQQRLQARHELSKDVAFIYESTSLFKPYWLLKTVQCSDDEDYYWINWHDSLIAAEQEYKSDHSENFENIMLIKRQLQQTINDSDASSSSTTASEEAALYRPTVYYNPPDSSDSSSDDY